MFKNSVKFSIIVARSGEKMRIMEIRPAALTELALCRVLPNLLRAVLFIRGVLVPPGSNKFKYNTSKYSQ